MSNKPIAVLFSLALIAGSSPARADIVFEETNQSAGSPMGDGGAKTKVFISGGNFRAQKKLAIDTAGMADSMKMSQQMGGSNMGMMNKMMRAGRPEYPDHIMSLSEWAEFDENKKLIEEVKKAQGGGGKFGELKKTGKDIAKGFGRLKNPGKLLMGRGDAPEAAAKTAGDIMAKYSQELDAGVLEKKKDDMAASIAKDGGMGLGALATVTSYDQWLRAKIIRDACGGDNGLQEILAISEESSDEYKDLKRKYELKSEHKAEYAKAREGAKEIGGKMEKAMGAGIKAATSEVNDMLLNVQIIRVEEDKVIEVFPPKAGKDPKPEDISYEVKSLRQVKAKLEENDRVKQKAMKGNEAQMKAGQAQMAAARAKYGNAVPGSEAPEAKLIGKEKVNGIASEHWRIKGLSGTDDYWVSKSFPGADEIMAFDEMLREKIGAGREGLSFGGAGGGMPDMAAIMAMGASDDMAAELAKIKARGVVIKHVNTQKGAAPSRANMLANQQTASGDMGDIGAKYMAQNRNPDPRMAQDPAAMQAMLAQMGQGMGAEAQAAAEKRQAAGGYKTGDAQDLVNTYELKVVGTAPIPEGAFQPPAGARKK